MFIHSQNAGRVQLCKKRLSTQKKHRMMKCSPAIGSDGRWGATHIGTDETEAATELGTSPCGRQGGTTGSTPEGESPCER